MQHRGFCSLFVVFTDAIRVVNTKFPTLFVIMLIALASCDRAKTKQAQTQPASFRDNIFASVTPTADGGAYAIGHSALWYLRRSSSVKVRFSNLPIDTDDRFFATLEITPLLDGGAYAYSTADKSAFWYIHADIAERVTEVPSLSSVAPVAPTSAFPLYIAERQKRLQAEEELTEVIIRKIEDGRIKYLPVRIKLRAILLFRRDQSPDLSRFELGIWRVLRGGLSTFDEGQSLMTDFDNRHTLLDILYAFAGGLSSRDSCLNLVERQIKTITSGWEEVTAGYAEWQSLTIPKQPKHN